MTPTCFYSLGLLVYYSSVCVAWKSRFSNCTWQRLLWCLQFFLFCFFPRLTKNLYNKNEIITVILTGLSCHIHKNTPTNLNPHRNVKGQRRHQDVGGKNPQTVVSNTAFSFEITVIGKFRVCHFNSEILIGEARRVFPSGKVFNSLGWGMMVKLIWQRALSCSNPRMKFFARVYALGEIRGLCAVFTEQLLWDINTSTFWWVSNKQNGLLSPNMVLC